MSADPVAARLVVGLAGPDLDPRERQWLDRWRPAGVILFARNVTGADGLAALVAAVHEVLGPEAEICADHEGGPVSFLQAVAGRPPAPRSLGRLDRPDLTTAVHLETARRLRALGLTRVLAPVCDVLGHRHNPVIGARAFGEDAPLVARHAGAAAMGLRQAGLQGCAKHWPDHGGSAADTHAVAVRPAVARPAGFEAVLAAGIDAVMVGHLPLGHGQPPLSLDRGGLRALRRRLGRAVQLWSDDVSMGALRPAMTAHGILAGDGRQEGLADPARLPRPWLEACAQAGCQRLLLRGIPWQAFPLPGGDQGPALPDPAPPGAAPPGAAPPGAAIPGAAPPGAAPPADAAANGPDAAVYADVRTRLAASVALAPGPGRLLWFDATAGDRLGAAAPGLTPLVRRAWPDHVRVDAAAPRLAPGPPFARLLITAHRPLNLAHAQLLEPLLAALGTGLVMGHPGLLDDVSRLAGPGWRLDALDDTSPLDLAALL